MKTRIALFYISNTASRFFTCTKNSVNIRRNENLVLSTLSCAGHNGTPQKNFNFIPVPQKNKWTKRPK